MVRMLTMKNGEKHRIVQCHKCFAWSCIDSRYCHNCNRELPHVWTEETDGKCDAEALHRVHVRYGNHALDLAVMDEIFLLTMEQAMDAQETMYHSAPKERNGVEWNDDERGISEAFELFGFEQSGNRPCDATPFESCEECNSADICPKFKETELSKCSFCIHEDCTASIRGYDARLIESYQRIVNQNSPYEKQAARHNIEIGRLIAKSLDL